jgi:SAM-dependent methyltransferase
MSPLPPAAPRPDPLGAWSVALGEWAIPDDLLATAQDDPWAVGGAVYRERAHAAAAATREPQAVDDRSRAVALEALAALPGGRGTVLDVGAGAGAAGLALASRLTRLTGIDRSAPLLDALLAEARGAGVEAQAIPGRWPEVAEAIPVHDVVTCHHVLYDVPDLAPFVTALAAHARRRVVVELSLRHPLAWTNPLWLHFHAIVRPERPTVDDALAALRELGIAPSITRWERESEPASVEAAATRARRNLCLPPSREAEVAEVITRLVASGELTGGPALGGRTVATIWWDTPSG